MTWPLRGGRFAAVVAGCSALVLVAAGLLAPHLVADESGDSGASASVLQHGRSTPCSRLTVQAVEVDGGCESTPDKQIVTFRISSLLGEYRFGECPIELTARLGPQGQLALHDIYSGGVGTANEGPCGDIGACQRPSKAGDPPVAMPWTGKVTHVDGGRARVVLDVCIDSCFGRFEGDTDMHLRRDAEGVWRLEARDSPVGVSGMVIAGGWSLRLFFGGDLQIRGGADSS